MAQTGRARCAAIDPQILVTLWQPVIELRWPVGMNRVRLTKDLLEQGYTYDELARRARGAELVRVRRGAYATRSEQLVDPRVAHLHLLEATVGQSSDESVVSHAVPIARSARCGLRSYPPSSSDPVKRRACFTASSCRSAARNRGPRPHPELPGRTGLDLSCAFRPLLAVPIGDAALRAGMSADALTQQLARAGARHGIRQARRTATLLDPRSESPGESMSRVVFADHRIPAPEPQFRVYDRAGRLAGPLRLRLGGAAHRR